MAAAESTMMRQQQDKPLGNLGEKGGGGTDSVLRPRVVFGPDENGVRKVIRYCCDDEGNKFEVVTTITPVGKLARAPFTKSSIKRNPMPSHADAVEDDAKSRLTNVPERPHLSGNNAQECGVPIMAPMECLICCSKGHHWTMKCPSRAQASAVLSPIADGPSPPMVPMQCLICCSKGHHWTIKCPSRAQATVGTSPIADGPSLPREAVKRAYPVRSADRIRDDVKRIMNDDRCARVTNLSKEAGEQHLVRLFSIFGFVTNVYIPVDENGSSRGVGYVKFAHRREAESAIENLNGWVYQNLTLQVGWAAPLHKGPRLK